MLRLLHESSFWNPIRKKLDKSGYVFLVREFREGEGNSDRRLQEPAREGLPRVRDPQKQSGHRPQVSSSFIRLELVCR